MVHTSFLWLAWIVGCVQALTLLQREKPAIVQIPVQRADNRPTHLQKRSYEWGESHSLFINVTIGVPPQKIRARVDTTSGYLVVTSSNSSYCGLENGHRYDAEFCQMPHVFNTSASSTYKDLDRIFNVTYPYGSSLSGAFASDVVTFNALAAYTDIAVNSGSQWDSIYALGYVGNDTNSYSGVLQSLVHSRRIKSAAYSFWTEDLSTADSSLLLGGVNKAKYIGELHTMPIPAVNGVRYLPVVLVTGVTIPTSSGNKTHTSGLPVYAALDTGRGITYLPNPIIQQIYEDLGVTFYPPGQIGHVDCDVKYKDYNLTFHFPGFNMSIPIANFILLDHGGEKCELGLVPSGEDAVVLGATFLSMVYVVYDLSSNEISMAPTRFESTDDDFMEIAAAVSDPISISVTASAPIPTNLLHSGLSEFPPTTTTTTSTPSPSSATSTSRGAAVGPTSSPNHILAGVIGAGVLFAL